ncbi:enoyl-CoA hydratase/isomerase family protein [Novosphingobium sp. PS1R-30]|uniref:Enoyl-CoA hydratase/isomerase family protein n=1 Tax=Novosphingobium anseongense TaxID=3133436 RepID=A0ABU8RZQ1_9SPHN
MDHAVRWRRSDKVGHLAFCRSSKRNALRMTDWAKLSDMLEVISKAGVQALIIESLDPEVFSAGSDLVEVEAFSKEPGDAAPFAIAMQRVMQQLGAGPMVTLAAIAGPCHGAGVAIAMACDIRVAGPRATFSIPPAKFGISHPSGDIRRLARLVGPGQAARLLYSAETIDAQEAARIGLVDLLDDDVAARCQDLAQKIAANSGESITLLKGALDRDLLAAGPDQQFLDGFRTADFLRFAGRNRGQV